MSDKIFVTYENFRHFCPTKNFVHFQNLKLAQKRLNSFILFRDSPFLYHKNNYFSKKLLFNNYAHLDLTVLNQRWLSFHFWPDHFTKVFLDILIIQIVNLRWFYFFLWFHHLTILILLYYASLSFLASKSQE